MNYTQRSADAGQVSLYKANTYVEGPRLRRGFISGRVHGAFILEHLQNNCQWPSLHAG